MTAKNEKTRTLIAVADLDSSIANEQARDRALTTQPSLSPEALARKIASEAVPTLKAEFEAALKKHLAENPNSELWNHPETLITLAFGRSEEEGKAMVRHLVPGTQNVPIERPSTVEQLERLDHTIDDLHSEEEREAILRESAWDPRR